VAVCLLPAGIGHAQGPDTFRATPEQTARLLFVAGDVRRLNRTPSGTVDTVLEKVLQQLYRDDPALAPEDAEREIERLHDTLAANGAATSSATLATVPGNQRVLAILAGLRRSDPPARVQRALTRVADQALTESSQTARPVGDVFNAGADSLSTVLYGGFSPPITLGDTVDLAADNARFGRARDALWADVSHQSVRDDANELLAGNPELRSDAVRAVTQGLAADGSLTKSVAAVEDLVSSGTQTVAAQSTRAIADHRAIAASCPGVDCAAYSQGAREASAAARRRIAEQQAALTAAGGLLSVEDVEYGKAIAAEAQASAQVANAVNSYFAASDIGEKLHAASDVAGLLVSLSVAYVDPAAAVTGVINIVRDVIARETAGPDANALILEGLRGVSQQLSAFARATETQFRNIDARLETLTRDVATLADQLNAQLDQARTQLTGLSSALITLQTSVDRLHAEIQRLFAQGARNDLDTIVNQWLGRGGLSADQLAVPAGALYTDATRIALRETVLNPTSAFDALSAGMRGELDPNVNFFALFPGRVSDSPSGIAWPPALADTCPGGSPSRGLCLPAPDFWAASSRAYAQLLLENRGVVTRDRLAQLDAILAGGRALERALDRIAARDTDGGTGSQLFNASLDYYDSWVGRDADRHSGPPTLLQALRAERERYLAAVKPTDVGSTGPFIDPYGRVNQPLGDVDLLDAASFRDVRSADGRFTIPSLRATPRLVTWLPPEVLNAVRLGVARVRVTWTASWGSTPPAPGEDGSLSVRLSYTLTGAGADIPLGWVESFRLLEHNCSGGPDSAALTVVAGWPPSAPGCRPNAPRDLDTIAAGGTATGRRDQSGFAAGVAAVTPRIQTRFGELRDGILGNWLAEDGSLTSGNGTQATNARAAAERVGGAQTLVNGYVTLGFPQALATDDTLRSLVAGDRANALARPILDHRRAEPASNVPDQVAAFVRFLQPLHPVADPVDTLGYAFATHRRALESSIAPYVRTGRAAGQSATDGGRLDQSSPLVASTIDRLELSRAVLAEHLNPPAQARTPTPTPTSTPTPIVSAGGEATAPPAATPPAAAPAPAVTTPAPARGRIIRAPRARGRAITLTVGCATGSCRIATALTAGSRSVGRAAPVSIAAGAQQTITVRLNAAGRRQLARNGRLRVTVRITLAGNSRPLTQTSLTLRG
jgi:hypothetical protein